jgi:hypothetical protein
MANDEKRKREKGKRQKEKGKKQSGLQPSPFSFFLLPFSLRSFADVGHQRHEAGALDGVLDGALEGGAVAAALAAEQLALVGAHFLQSLHVFVIDKRGARAAFLRAKAAAILATFSLLSADHASVPYRNE